MAYCELADIQLAIGTTKLSQLVADASGETLSTEAVLNRVSQAISSSDAKINAAMAGRYTVPVTSTVPADLERLSIEGAICELFRRRMSTLSEEDKWRIDQHEATLRRIRDGDQLVVGLAVTRGLPATSRSNANAPDRVFCVDLTDGTDPLGGYA